MAHDEPFLDRSDLKMTTTTEKKYLTITDICNEFGLSRSTFYRLRSGGNFPDGVMISPGKIGWIVSEVKEWWANLGRTAALGRI